VRFPTTGDNEIFLINEEKSIFVPTQKLEWLGILWDSQLFSLSIPDRRISDLLCSITHIIDFFPVFTARKLAQEAILLASEYITTDVGR
jgi:hypothetical protein